MLAQSNPKTGLGRPTFGQNLRCARHAAGLTQTSLAEAAGLDRAAIGLCERDRREPSLHTIRKLARVLEVGASEPVRGL